jgi:hypothetical protein
MIEFTILKNIMAYLYRHIRLDKKEPFYIGISSDDSYKRANEKSKRNNYWKNIINKSEYEVEILIDNITWKEACKKKKEFIALYGRLNLNNGTLCNMTDGGEGLINPSKETRDKKRNSMIGKNLGSSNGMTKLENKIKVSNSRKGKFTGKNSFVSKSINCYNLLGTLLATYDSITEAEKQTGVKNSNIVKVCKGFRKTAGNFIWKYNHSL